MQNFATFPLFFVLFFIRKQGQSGMCGKSAGASMSSSSFKTSSSSSSSSSTTSTSQPVSGLSKAGQPQNGSWGPVFKNKDHFASLHFCWKIISITFFLHSSKKPNAKHFLCSYTAANLWREHFRFLTNRNYFLMPSFLCGGKDPKENWEASTSTHVGNVERSIFLR